MFLFICLQSLHIFYAAIKLAVIKPLLKKSSLNLTLSSNHRIFFNLSFRSKMPKAVYLQKMKKNLSLERFLASP